MQLCVSACRLEMKLPAERMIPFLMRGGTGTELSTGDTADLLLWGEADALNIAFRGLKTWSNVFRNARTSTGIVK